MADENAGQAIDDPQCWGATLKGDNGAGCDNTFERGRRHMCAAPLFPPMLWAHAQKGHTPS